MYKAADAESVWDELEMIMEPESAADHAEGAWGSGFGDGNENEDDGADDGVAAKPGRAQRRRVGAAQSGEDAGKFGGTQSTVLKDGLVFEQTSGTGITSGNSSITVVPAYPGHWESGNVHGASNNSATYTNSKDALRRATVAAASRATRAKRKRELEELKERTVRLEKEREGFLSTIADLQMKVQAVRESGSIDLQMENDLLRAELMEHKNFISKFKRIADGMPTSLSAKKLMCQQGSDTAVAQVLGLLSTSMVDPSWQRGLIRNHPELQMRYQRLPHGEPAGNAKRCSVRIDIPVVPCENPAQLASILWSTWCNEDLNARINKHFGAVSVSVREIDTGVEGIDNGESFDAAFPISPASLKNEQSTGKSKSSDSISSALSNKVKVYYYREEIPNDSGQNDNVDTVLLLSAREKSISCSSFPEEAQFNRFPWPSPSRDTSTSRSTELSQQLSEKKHDAIVLASTSTQHSIGLVPLKPGVHRIHSALLEGSVFRAVEGGVAMTSIVSYPSVTEKKRTDVLVDDDGYLNVVWTAVVSEVYSIVRESMPESVYSKYRLMRDQGHILPNELADFL